MYSVFVFASLFLTLEWAFVLGVKKPGYASEHVEVPLYSTSRCLNVPAKLPHRNTNNGGSKTFKSTEDSLQNACFSTCRVRQVRSKPPGLMFSSYEDELWETICMPNQMYISVNMVKTRISLGNLGYSVHVNAHIVTMFAYLALNCKHLTKCTVSTSISLDWELVSVQQPDWFLACWVKYFQVTRTCIYLYFLSPRIDSHQCKSLNRLLYAITWKMTECLFKRNHYV